MAAPAVATAARVRAAALAAVARVAARVRAAVQAAAALVAARVRAEAPVVERAATPAAARAARVATPVVERQPLRELQLPVVRLRTVHLLGVERLLRRNRVRWNRGGTFAWA